MFMMLLANVQKICISKVIDQFPRVQISHKSNAKIISSKYLQQMELYILL